MTRKATIWYAVAGAAVILAIVLAIVLRPRSQAPPAVASPQVALATARFGTFEVSVTATGTVGAPSGSQSKVAFIESGVLASVYVRVGERVVAGQELARLNSQALALTAAQTAANARAAAAGARAAAVDRTSTKIAVDREALARARALYSSGVGARKDIGAAQAQLAADEADAATLRAQRVQAAAQAQGALAAAQLAQRNYANGVLYAPSSGVIVAIYKHPGEAVDSTTPVLALGPGDQHEVTLAVPAQEVQSVRVGDSVTLSLPGTGLRGSGRVRSVVPAVDPTTQSATVVISGVPAGAVAGTAVQATIVTGRERGVLVPQSAIVQDPQSGRTVVFAQTHSRSGDTRFSQRAVSVLHMNGTTAEIASGLRAGERVAAEGAFALLAP